jgi:hypothetical protein
VSSSNGFAEVLELQADDGRLAAALQISWLLPAALAVLVSDLPGLWQAVLCAGAAAGGIRELPGLVWKARSPPVRAVCGRDGRWTLVRGDRGPVSAGLVGAWGVTHGPIIGLSWHLEGGGTHEMWIAKWVTPARSWRRLRTRLRLS